MKSQQIESLSKEIENIKKKMKILNLKIITKIKHLSWWTKYQNAEERWMNNWTEK